MNMFGEIGINPVYVAYAKAHGCTPEDMLEHDSNAWPGGCMCGFMLWVSEQKQKFWKACPSAFLDRYTINDVGKWLELIQ